nr:CCA tRNA nucleotidyltransferase [Acetobacter fallax]
MPEARLVGGAVRDLLLNTDVADFDFGTPEPPEQVSSILRNGGIKVIPTGLSHGTVTAVIEGNNFEITTLRRDEQTDGRHAQVAWTRNWREDAARRDFTINAMSCGLNGQVHDYFGGQHDLRMSRIRFVGDARERIREDALRILRFFRFQGRFGGTEPDQETLDAISDCAVLVRKLSAERVWAELRRILVGPHVVQMLELMARSGVLGECFPELTGRDDTAIALLASLIACGGPCDESLRLAALLKGAGATLDMIERCVHRLRLSRSGATEVISMSGYPIPTPQNAKDDDDIARLLANTPRSSLTGRTWLARAEAEQHGLTSIAREDWVALLCRLKMREQPHFPLAGRDIVALGVLAGPRVGEVLSVVRQWWLDGGCHEGKKACLTFAKYELATGR